MVVLNIMTWPIDLDVNLYPYITRFKENTITGTFYISQIPTMMASM
jgi:uncharacterized protein YqjF (DUF2071 family)